MLGTVSDTIERNPQTDGYDSDWWTAFRAVNGIVSPSRLKPGQSPIKFPEGGKLTKNYYKNKCLICGDYFSCRDILKTHFVDCVGRNGNPQGFYWNTELDKEERLGQEGDPRCGPEILARLNAINGLVIPSLLKPGQPPIESSFKRPFAGVTNFKRCPICDDQFKTEDSLRCHFVECVDRNGNPQGLCWSAYLDGKERLGWKKSPMLRRGLSARLNAVNGVVIPSLLKPGQPPIQPRSSKHMKKIAPKRRDRGGNNYCVICHGAFDTWAQLRGHFAPCVQRNGNPHGYYWNDLLENRIGRETTGLHCEKDGGRDHHTETSTNKVVSSDNHQISSDQSSESCNTTKPSGPRSLALMPRLHHKSNEYTEAPPVARTETDHGFGSVVIELSDDEAADMGIDTAQPQVCGPSKIDCRSANVYFRVHRQSSLETYKRVHIVCLMKASSRPWPSLQAIQTGVTRVKPLW